MSYAYYNLCRANIGKGICIKTKCGTVYRGVICSVNGNAVGIRPLGTGIEGQHASFKASTAEGDTKGNGSKIQWFGSFFWIPFFSILALSLFFI